MKTFLPVYFSYILWSFVNYQLRSSSGLVLMEMNFSDIHYVTAVEACFGCFLLTTVEWRPLLEEEVSPVLHAGGEGVHTSSYSPDGETCLDNWVRVEKHSLDHIQNICISVKVGK